MGALDRFLKRGRIQDFSRGPIAKMLSELRKFGANGHLYIPGVGAISGITAGNYLDSIGTTSASVDGNVGLVLDGVGSLGAELAPALVPANWTVINTDATHLVTWGASSFRYQCDAFSPSLTVQKSGLLTVGKTYKVEITVSAYTSGSLKSDPFTAMIVNGLGKFTFTVVAVNPSFNLYRNAAVTDLTVSGISIKEVTGIHASQATTGYQPKLRRGIVNLLTYSNDLTNASWSITAGGTKQSANSIAFSVTNDQLGQTVNTDASVGVSATGAVILSGAGSIVLVLARSGSGAYEDSLLTINLTPTPTLYTVSKTIANAGQTGFRLALVKAAGSTATSVTMDGAAVLKETLTAQQILAAGGIPVTTSAPASSSSGAYKLDFDGTDDFMSLGSVPFQMADDHYTAVALTPNAINTGKHILNLANGAASQQVGSIAVNGNSQFSARWCDDATNLLGVADAVTVTPGVASVLASRRVGTTGALRKNGAQLGAISLASLGATTLTLPGVIGSYKGGVNPSAISLHGVVVIKGTVSDAQALIFERGLNAIAQYAAGGF